MREIAALLAIEGASRFKVRAFERGARTIESVPGDLAALVAAGDLTRLPGIGPVLAATVGEIVLTGASSMLTDLKRRLPPGVAELSTVLSLPRIKTLHEALGVGSLAELEAACRAGRVRTVKGFGEKTERRILDAIAARDERGESSSSTRPTRRRRPSSACCEPCRASRRRRSRARCAAARK